MEKRIGTALMGALVLLVATALTEYLFYRQDQTKWVKRFEWRLHQEERKADELLATFGDQVDIEVEKWEDDLIFVGFKKGKIFFWTNENIGRQDLFERLAEGGNFIKVANAYFEVRRRKYEDIDYFALLRIKDLNPYTSKYIKNRFGKFLDIAEENIQEVEVFPSSVENGHLIKDKDGNRLFYIVYGDHYKERASNYLLITCYLLFFLSLFYVYDLILKNTVSWKKQLGYFFGFILLLCGLRYFMQTFRLPPTPYRLPIFDNISKEIFISSIGDLLMTTFCIFEICYITLANLKINYQSERLRRYRYVVAGGILVLIFLYIDFFNFAIDLVVENMDIHLNIAQLVHVGIASIISFVAIIMGGLVIIVAIYGAVNVFHHMLRFTTVVKLVTVWCLVLVFISYLFSLYTNYWDCFFLWIVFILLAINKYLIKRDFQRSLYIVVIFLLSIYIVMVTKKYESYKEQRQRIDYATELIEERDYNFEERLVEMDAEIRESDELRQLLAEKKDQQAENLLKEQLLNMRGYNYYPDITFCGLCDSLWLTDLQEQWGCREYFDLLIRKYGHQIQETAFYTIGIFDGYVTYIGRFPFGDTYLYLRFDAMKDDEGPGYPQILSRKSEDDKDNVYFYSYAKYSDGNLVSSSGNFVYYKKLSAFGKDSRNFDLFEKDKYSHMMIPVDDRHTLVISLHESTFTLYYMNVLYAFFVCILISSYGLFFNVNKNLNFRRGTLKARIKNNIISLIFILFVILTALSIYTNTKSFEGRHNAKVIELLKYVNKELEQLPCVDSRECPDITKTLSNMSELLLVDINIYSDQGQLIATSRPEIFEYGFKGNLVDPLALKQIEEVDVTSFVSNEQIGELGYISAYMPLVLDNGKSYILNIPYFAQNDELNLDIIIMVVITVNIAIVMMVLAFILSGLVADRVTRPLQMLNEKLKKMRLGGKNEKIAYHHQDEVGVLVQEYNNMVDKLDESVEQLARSERESAWREMARQIAHEIKNPLTPMKLNIQFMLRSLQMEDTEKFKERFRDISGMLIEQIDNMAAIASAFSDFAKISEAHAEVFDMGEVVKNCTLLFRNNVDNIGCEVEDGLTVLADKSQMRRVLINLLKNAVQSIPETQEGNIKVTVKGRQDMVEIRIKDNGCGIGEEFRKKIFQPNFTTKSSGTGLGLAISRRIIESFGGQIGFVSEVGQGTEFFILMNRAKKDIR